MPAAFLEPTNKEHEQDRSRSLFVPNLESHILSLPLYPIHEKRSLGLSPHSQEGTTQAQE